MKELLGDNYKSYLYNKENLIKYLKKYKHSMAKMQHLEDGNSNGFLFNKIGWSNETFSKSYFHNYGFVVFLWAFLLNQKDKLSHKQRLKIESAIQTFVSGLKEWEDRPLFFNKTKYVEQKITKLQSDKSYKHYHSELGFFSAMTFDFKVSFHATTVQVRKYPADEDGVFRLLMCNGGVFGKVIFENKDKDNNFVSKSGFVANEYKMDVETLKKLLFDIVDFTGFQKDSKGEAFFTELNKNNITYKSFGYFQHSGNCPTNSANILLREILDDDLLHTLFRDFFLNKNAKGEFLFKMPDFIQKLKEETITLPKVKQILEAEKTEYIAKIENVLNKIYENEDFKLKDTRLETIKNQPIEKVMTLDVLKDIHNELKIKQLEQQILDLSKDLSKNETVDFCMYREGEDHTVVEVKDGNIYIKNYYNKYDDDTFKELHFDEITEKILFYTKLRNRMSKNSIPFKDYTTPSLSENDKFKRVHKEFYINIKSALGIQLIEYDKEVSYTYKDHNDEERDVKIELGTNKVFQDGKEISRAEFIDTIHEPLNIAIIDQNNQKLDKDRKKIKIKYSDIGDKTLQHKQGDSNPLIQGSQVSQNDIKEIPPASPKQTPPKQKFSIDFNKITDASYRYEAVISSRKIVRSKTDNLNEIRVYVDNVLEQIVKERPEILDLKNKAENLFKSLAEYSHKYSHLKGKDAGFQAWKGKPEFQEILQRNGLGTDVTSLNELGKISGFYQKKGSETYTETGRIYLDGLFSRTYRDACVLYPPERGLAEFSKTQGIN